MYLSFGACPGFPKICFCIHKVYHLTTQFQQKDVTHINKVGQYKETQK